MLQFLLFIKKTSRSLFSLLIIVSSLCCLLLLNFWSVLPILIAWIFSPSSFALDPKNFHSEVCSPEWDPLVRKWTYSAAYKRQIWKKLEQPQFPIASERFLKIINGRLIIHLESEISCCIYKSSCQKSNQTAKCSSTLCHFYFTFMTPDKACNNHSQSVMNQWLLLCKIGFSFY